MYNNIKMVIIYDKLEKKFYGHRDYGVVSMLTGRSVGWLRSLDKVVEDEFFMVGNLDEVKSRRGGKRGGSNGF